MDDDYRILNYSFIYSKALNNLIANYSALYIQRQCSSTTIHPSTTASNANVSKEADRINYQGAF